MNTESIVHQELETGARDGWAMLPQLLGLLGLSVAMLVVCPIIGTQSGFWPIWILFVAAIPMLPVSIILLTGFFTLQPNEARLLILFGIYKGTVRKSGFYWGNPFYANGGPRSPGFTAESHAGYSPNTQPGASQPAQNAQGQRRNTRYKISLRARTLNGERLKVNDKRGNPIEIAAVVVWRVQDTAKAVFDVDDYEKYVQTQSETSLRHLASTYAYDHGEENETTLRSGLDEVSQALRAELTTRLQKAGVVVDEARLTHLAYAPEIAQAMLRRQQAEAVIAARQKIVQGAVSMVDMALKELAAKRVVELDDDRKAAMVSNLMVVLCGESEVHPIVNTGTLYT